MTREWLKGAAPLLFLLISIAAPVAVRAQTPAPPSGTAAPVILDVRVEGNRRLSDAAFFRLTTLRSRQNYDETTIRRQFRVLWETGVFDDIWVETFDAPGGKVVVFHVRERPVVTRVTYQKSAVVAQTAIDERLTERNLQITLNAPVDRQQIRAVEEEIKRLHEEKGFLGTEVSAEIVDVGENVQEVTFSIRPGAKTLMKKISFDGNTLFSDRELKKLMPNTIETGFKGAFSKKDLYHPLRFGQELEAVRSAYQARGRLDVDIKAPIVEFVQKPRKKKKELPPYEPLPVPESETPKQKRKREKKEAKRRAKYEKKLSKQLPPKRKAIITVPLAEGPEYKVGEVAIEGNEVFPSESLRALIPLRSGQVFNTNALRRGLDAIESLYGQQGYYYASSNRRINRQPENVADVTVVVTEGDQYKIRRIEFTGNTSTKDRVLRRELPIAEESTFNTRLWQIGLTRINQLGYWALASEPSIAPSTEEEAALDATIQGAEQGRNEIQVGGGFSGVEGAFFQGSYATRNFLGRGEILQASIQVGGVSELINLSFTEPYFLGTNNTVGASVFRRELDFQDFSRDSTGYSLLFGQRLGNFTSYAVTYRNVRFDEAGGTIFFVDPLALDPDFDVNGLFAGEFGTPIPIGIETVNSSLLPVFTHNTVNNPFRPNRGFRLRATVELTGTFLGGDNEFIKPILTATWYHPALKRSYFALHGEVGLVEGLNDKLVPRSERFFLGGDIRGPRVFETRSLAPVGPVAFVPPITDDSGNVIGIPFAEVGGDSFFLAQAEYVVNMTQSVDVALFVDAGNAFDSDAGDGFDLSNLRYSTGIELRFYLPIFQAPMRLIWGKVLDEEPQDQLNSFRFSIGFPF